MWTTKRLRRFKTTLRYVKLRFARVVALSSLTDAVCSRGDCGAILIETGSNDAVRTSVEEVFASRRERGLDQRLMSNVFKRGLDLIAKLWRAEQV